MKTTQLKKTLRLSIQKKLCITISSEPAELAKISARHSERNNRNVLRVNGKCKHRSTVSQMGFTLIELIITLAIAAILISIVTPSFRQFIQQTRLTLAVNALHNAINLTRMEALKRNGRVDLIAHGKSWKNGWMITADRQQIMEHEALHDDIHVSSTFPESTVPYIAYNGTGHTRSNANTNSPLHGKISLSIGNNSRTIIVNFLGNTRVCNPATAPPGTCGIALDRK